ncbi:MAG: dephospho-CoA kinase [Lachnospiraceae bacterium]|jgi:dephospho-CoA kinase
MKVIGITGGVGSGKSEVLNYMEAHFDARIVQADDVDHLLTQPGGICYQKEIELFGKDILKKDGSIDRSRIAEIVFHDKDKLKQLNAIVHPAVKDYIVKELEKARKENYEFFFIEAALLLEDDYKGMCDEVWYVYCEEEVRRERLKKSRGYSDEKISSMMANQLPEQVFEENCDFQLYNSEDVAHTYLQIERRIRSYYETL